MPDLETVDFGDEPADESITALEKKYSKQMREIVSQKIDLPISTLPSMIKDQINLNPDFQRRGRWDREQQSRFIERSEEHTSELQSHLNLVCRLLLEKKKN